MVVDLKVTLVATDSFEDLSDLLRKQWTAFCHSGPALTAKQCFERVYFHFKIQFWLLFECKSTTILRRLSAQLDFIKPHIILCYAYR
jgi:hypothetical protein